MARLRHLQAGEAGQAIIEFALTLPLLLLVVMGIFDFGLMFQKYEAVTNAAREGARIGVLPDYTPAHAQQRALAYLAASGMTGTPRGTLASCAGTFVAGSRCVSAVLGTTTITGVSPTVTVSIITVTATYDFQYRFVGPLMNVFGNGLGNSRLTAVSVMRLEGS
jgi:Flp pilus assembly protein TadG